jgi:hypothetical protein
LAQETEALAKLWADAGISRLEAKVGEMEAAKEKACSSHTQTANHGAIRCDRGSGHDGEHVAMEGLVGEVTWGEPKAKDHDPSTRAVEETAVPVIERCPMAFARKDAYSLGLLGGDAGVEAVRCARDAGHAGEHLGTRPGLDRVVRW